MTGEQMSEKPDKESHRAILRRIARRLMVEKGLETDFSPAVMTQIDGISQPAKRDSESIRDLRSLIWCSIDNDDSRDLDQLTVAKNGLGGCTTILVAIADVDALVKKDSQIDGRAADNTTSVYTAGEIFPMLHEKLSTDLTSLNDKVERLAVVVEMNFDLDGKLKKTDVYRALVFNHAKLAYNSIGRWLDGESPLPDAAAAVAGLEQNLKTQDRVAQLLKSIREEHGSLELDTITTRPLFVNDQLTELYVDQQNRAKELIANFMIAANGVIARFLNAHKRSSIRRVVSRPKRWERIVELAADWGTQLPKEPNSVALEEFLAVAKNQDPLRFPDLSLSVVKLLGPGEYVALRAGEFAAGHFGLAVGDYAHSTAPNRRFPDVITQRLVKACLDGADAPYSDDELEALARHCTDRENAVKKIERQCRKSAAALLLQNRVGQSFDAIVTGVSEGATWVRVLHPPIEGRLVKGTGGSDVGHRIRVQLVATDIEHGFIDFRRLR